MRCSDYSMTVDEYQVGKVHLGDDHPALWRGLRTCAEEAGPPRGLFSQLTPT
jgi:hypothetical protein